MTLPHHDPNSDESPGPDALYTKHTPEMLDTAAALSQEPRKPTRRWQDVAERFDALLRVASDATIVADVCGHIRLVNRPMQTLFGYSADELLGQPIELLVPDRWPALHQPERAEYAQTLQALPIGSRLDLLGRKRDRSEFPIEVSLWPIFLEDESLVVATIVDITERRRAYATLEATNHDLRAMQALTDTALSHLTLDDLLAALLKRATSVLHVDNAAVLLLDGSGDTLTVRAVHGLEEPVASQVHVPLGQGFAGRIAATRQPLVVDDLAAISVTNPFLREQLHSAVGVPLLVGDQLLGVIHVGTAHPRHFTNHDVQLLLQVADRMAVAIDRARAYGREQHARETAEAALAQAQISEQRYRRLVEGNIIGIVVSDGEQIFEANDAFLRLIGYTRADLDAGLVRRTSFMTRESDAQSRRGHLEALATGASAPTEREYVRKDGSRVPALAGVTLLQRDPIRYVTFALDLSVRKQLEREREAARAAVLAAQEVAQQLDSFFAVAAHDIRNPITVVSGYNQVAGRRAQQLADNLAASAQANTLSVEATVKAVEGILDGLRNAKAGVDRLQRMVDYLFDVARARSGALKVILAPCDLAALARSVVTAQQVTMPERRIDLEVPPASVMVEADGDRLDQVLGNYLTNALKYSPADQPVTVRLEVIDHQARVSVSDHGPGLEPAEQRQIWELYHRAPSLEAQPGSGRPIGSLGLGLYISKQLVELHPGGHVGVESAKDHGSTFWFSLPLDHNFD
jgi:PAS domain S-box-containing protein